MVPVSGVAMSGFHTPLRDHTCPRIRMAGASGQDLREGRWALLVNLNTMAGHLSSRCFFEACQPTLGARSSHFPAHLS
jgi:hypothetical protein